MEKNKVVVRINGMDYTLVTPEKAEYVQRVAILADKKMSEISEHNPHLSTAMLAMLTAINLADDCLKLEDGADNLRKQVAEYSKKEQDTRGELEESQKKSAALEKEVQSLKIELARYKDRDEE